jgi:hypothetical protein
VVHLDVSRRPLDKDKTRIEVVLQATAVVDTEEGGQFLLDVGENMGMDYNDASQEKEGSKAAEKAEEKIIEVCDDLGLMVRPGIISV